MPYSALPTSTAGVLFPGAILSTQNLQANECATSQVQRAKPSEMIMSRHRQVMLVTLHTTDYFLTNKETVCL